jgi:hypothetical protein
MARDLVTLSGGGIRQLSAGFSSGTTDLPIASMSGAVFGGPSIPHREFQSDPLRDGMTTR